MPTTYGNEIVYCFKSHCGVRGYCRQKWVLQVQIICKFSNERTCKRNKDVQGLSCGFEDLLFLFHLQRNICKDTKKKVEMNKKLNPFAISTFSVTFANRNKAYIK